MTLIYVEGLKDKPKILATNVIDAWGKSHGSMPTVLWHYTSEQGFEGMLNSTELWLTNAKFMNDTSELDYGIALVKRTLLNMKSRYASPITQEFLERESVGIEVSNMLFGAYVFCLSEPDDLLSQWDRYADRSHGYSLGFRAADLVRGRPHLKLRKVEYEESAQTHIIECIAEQFCDLLERELDPSVEWKYNDLVLRDFGNAMLDVFIQHLYCFKHRGFREEQEWRLVETLGPVSGASRLLYRNSGSLTDVPYVKENMGVPNPPGSLPLVEVYYGPRLTSSVAESYLAGMFSSHGYSPAPKITRSTIPLR